MERLFIVLVFLLSLVFLAYSRDVPSVFIFGDSIFDAGNNHFNKNCTAQADFPPYGSSFFHLPTGRFTNGRTVADFVSQFLGIELQKPYLEAQIAVMNGSRKDYPSNGINFASAGSGVLRPTNQDLVKLIHSFSIGRTYSVILVSWILSGLFRNGGHFTILQVTPIQVQLQQFLTLIQQNKINKNQIQESIVFIESGSNDIFNYFLPLDTPTLDPDAYVRAMLVEVFSLIEQLYKVGVRRIALFSLGPVGCVPARALLPNAPTNKCYGEMNAMVEKYNKGLENLVSAIPARYPGAVAVYGAVYNIVRRFQANPTRYGFSDVSNACCGFGILGGQLQCGKEGYKICSNPNAFLFWDYFHPTEHAYKLISKALWTGRNSRIIKPINLKTLATMPL